MQRCTLSTVIPIRSELTVKPFQDPKYNNLFKGCDCFEDIDLTKQSAPLKIKGARKNHQALKDLLDEPVAKLPNPSPTNKPAPSHTPDKTRPQCDVNDVSNLSNVGIRQARGLQSLL